MAKIKLREVKLNLQCGRLFTFGPFQDEREMKSAARNIALGASVRVPLVLADSAWSRIKVMQRVRHLGWYLAIQDGPAVLYFDYYDSAADAEKRKASLVDLKPSVLNVPITLTEAI